MKNVLLIFLSSLMIFSCKAQPGPKYSTMDAKAVKHYKAALAYYDAKDNLNAINELNEAIKKDPKFIEAYTMKAYVYADTKKYEEAIVEMKKAIMINPNFFPANFFTLAKLEMATGKYADAKLDYQDYIKSPYVDPDLKQLANADIKNCDFAINAIAHPIPFKPTNMGAEVNTIDYEYFPSVTADDNTFLFTRNVRLKKNDPQKYGQEDFFYTTKSKGKWTPSQSIGANINTPANEGAPCLSVDGNTLFFVVCSDSKDFGLGRKGLGECDIFYAFKQGDKWSKAINVGSPVNTATWESQPSFSSDGRTLYYIHASTDSKGYKNEDIFMAQIKDDGHWTEPVRLSDKINTSGHEESVFIHPDNQTLYFASDGHVGMGGLDLYMSKRQPNGEWGEAINLGYPINTFNDENSILVNSSGTVAYFASDREGGFGGLDIYYFDVDKSYQPTKTTYMKGKVYDGVTKDPLEAKFVLIDLATGKEAAVSISNKGNGEFLVALPTNKDYMLNVSKDGYLFYSKNFSLKEMPNNKPYVIDVPLFKPDLNIDVRLDNVFFETNKFDLLPESRSELNNLADFLKKNPTIKIELQGHTDNVGKPKDNLVLSDNRAKAVYQYLIDNGIAKERMTYKGYGDTKPMSDNSTPEGRQKNRRTQFVITAK